MTVLYAGKTLFIPRISVEAPGHMDFLQLHGREDLGSLKAGTWGIKEPDLHWLGNPRQSGRLSLYTRRCVLTPGLLPFPALEAPGIDVILVPGTFSRRLLRRIPISLQSRRRF